MAAITSTTESWNGHKFSEVESHVKGNYLQLGGGTMTGRLNVNGDGSARGEIYLISSGDVPNDLYFGAGGSADWSISSRGTSDGKYIGLYNNVGKGWIWKVGYTTGILDFLYRPTYNGTNLALATDLNSYSLTSHTHSNYSLTNHTHSNYSLTSHTHNYLPTAGGTITGGQLSIRPTGGNYTDGIRIHARSSDNEWAAVVLCGVENSGDTGTSTNTWFIGANGGGLYIARNGTGMGGGSAYLRCISNVWDVNGNTIVHSGNSSHTHSEYSLTSHSHSNYSLTSHSHSNYSLTSHTHSNYSLTSHTHSYLPLTGGTLTGELDISDSAGRSTLKVVTPSNNPCDLWLGANNTDKWSLTCRASDESYNFDIYSNTTGAANGGHVVIFNSDGRSHFYETIHAVKHICVGANMTTYDTQRAELDLVSSTNVASELWYGVSGTRYWSMCCRPSGENYIYAFYTPSLGYAAQLDRSGNFQAAGGVTALSDIREKTIVKNIDISTEQIASASSVLFKWNDKRDDELHAGSIAQDWQKILPQAVLEGVDEKKTLSLNYGVAALVSSITTARDVVSIKEKIKSLEDEIAKLKEKL